MLCVLRSLRVYHANPTLSKQKANAETIKNTSSRLTKRNTLRLSVLSQPIAKKIPERNQTSRDSFKDVDLIAD
jgi:hypothetical protein